jgi:hypothetical protein
VPTRSRVNREKVKEEMGNWLGQLAPWDAYATWTFSRIVTAYGAMFWAKRHIEWLEHSAAQNVYGFVAAERGSNGGLIHLHALLGNVKHMQFYCGNKTPSPVATTKEAKHEKRWARKLKCCLTHAWPCGYATVFPYNPALGAKHYVAKYITKDLAEWDLFGLPTAPQMAFGHKGATFTVQN